MNKKLIVFDLDGTLLTPQFELLDGTIQAVQDLKAQGYRVTVATGRSYASAKPFLDKLDLIEPMIFSNGSVWDNPETQEREVVHGISLETALIVAILGKEFDLSLKVHFADGRILKSNSTPWPDEGKHFLVGEVVDNLPALIDEDPIKIVFHAESEKLEQFETRLNTVLGRKKNVRLFRSHAYYIEMTNEVISKGATLKQLLDVLEINPEEVIAVGDQENDLEMIRDCGIGVLAGEGTIKLLNVCNHQIPSPQDQGIEKLAAWLSGNE